MHLQFKSIRIVRFRSFENEAVLHFDSAGSGLYFLKGKNNAALGSNGAGKSTIIDALLWCLYGKTVQGLRNPDIIPWSGKGKTEVEVTLLVDKKQHVVKRTVGPNKLSIDDKEAGQEYVSNLIAIPFEILPYTIILGQRKPLFFDLGATDKLKLFSEVLNLDRWEQRAAHAASLVSSLEKEIESKTFEIVSLKREQERITEDTVRLKTQSQTWEAARAELINSGEQNKKMLQKQIASVMKERDTADLQLDRAETELKAIRSAMAPLNERERLLFKAYMETGQKQQSLSCDIEDLKNQIEGIDSKGSCPTCGQSLNDKNHAALQKTGQDKIVELKKQYKEATNDCKKAEEAHKKIIVTIDTQSEAKIKFEESADGARDILDKLLPKIANWEAEIKAIDRQLQTNETDSNPYTEQLQILRRRRDQLKDAIEQTEKSIITKTEYSERVKFWAKGFKDIKLLTIEEILQELEITTNAMCEEFGLVGWEIKYDIERENKSGNISRGLNITVLSPKNKAAVKWECWSGGEGQRLRIIGTAALSSVLLNHVGVSTNFEVYDEPTESLSREGISDLVELLAQRAKDTKKAIWLIDHHVIESSHFVQTTLVNKGKNGSVLEI